MLRYCEVKEKEIYSDKNLCEHKFSRNTNCCELRERHGIKMTQEDKEMLDKINDYANEVLADIDPQKTRISFQLDKLKPVMEEIAKDKNMKVEDVFIKYMDLASEASLQRQNDFQEEFKDFKDVANSIQ